MAVNNDPNYSTNIVSPDLHRIDREWCIGDSFIAINNNTVKLDNRVTALEAKFPIVTVDITNNAVTSQKIRPSTGWSVMGQSLSGLANPGDIIANNNNDVLRRVNNTLGFGTIGGDSIDNGSIGPGKLSPGAPTWTTSGSVSANVLTLFTGSNPLYIANANQPYIEIRDTTTPTTPTRVGLQATNITGGAGTISNHPFILRTNNVDRLWVDVTGEVGIGRDPGFALDVFRTGTTSTAIVAANANVSTVMQAVSSIQGNTGTITNHPLVFVTNNTEQARITTNGNVGIGTVNPSAKLQVAGKIVASTASGATAAGLMLDAPYELGSLATIGTEHSSGCITIGYGVSARPDSAEYFNNTINGPTSPRAAICTGGASGIRFYIDPNVGPNIPVGQPVSLNERLRITNSGLVGINTGPPSYMLHVNGNLASIGYTNLSDIREKENINYTTVPGLSTVLQLKPATFDYKGNNNLKNNFGFIAQDIQNILPNLITTGIDNENTDARLSLKENNLIAILVKAIQDLKAELDTVKQELQTLTK